MTDICISTEQLLVGRVISPTEVQQFNRYMTPVLLTLAMTEMLNYVPVALDESIDVQVESILRKWGRGRAKLSERVKVYGELKQHEFNFLVSPKKQQPVCISILNPTAGALSAAERFGFKIKDLAGTPSGKWRQVAVQAKAEVWSSDARKIVDRCADTVHF